MIGPEGMDYARPASVDAVVDLLSLHGPQARILAGGTDLLVDLRNGQPTPAPRLLIDIKSIPELGEIQVDEPHSSLTIGAAVSLNRIVEHRWIRNHVGGLADAAASVGTYQIRNRATLVGNLCHASPAADTAPVLLALDAKLRIVSRGGVSLTPLREFFVGVKTTTLSDDAFVSAVTIAIPEGSRTAFVKQQRVRGHDLAVANVGGVCFRDPQTVIVAIGSCAPTPVLLDPVIVDHAGPKELTERLCRLCARAVCPIDDVRASAAYRNAIIPALLEQCVLKLLSDSEPRFGQQQGGGECPRSR